MLRAMIEPKQQHSVKNIKFLHPNISNINNKHDQLSQVANSFIPAKKSIPVGRKETHNFDNLKFIDKPDMGHMATFNFKKGTSRHQIKEIKENKDNDEPISGNINNLSNVNVNDILSIGKSTSKIPPEIMTELQQAQTQAQSGSGIDDAFNYSDIYRFGAPKLTLLKPDTSNVNLRTQMLMDMKDGKPAIPLEELSKLSSIKPETVQLLKRLELAEKGKLRDEKADAVQNLKFGEAIVFGYLPTKYHKYIDKDVKDELLSDAGEFKKILRNLPTSVSDSISKGFDKIVRKHGIETS